MNKTVFKIISSEIKGDILISENTQFNNISAGNVRISSGVKARLFGNISETLILEKGASLFLHGVHKGKIENNGGHFLIFS